MPKEKKHGRNNQSRDQQISELVAAIVGYYDLKAKGKIGLRRCLTLLCKHYKIVLVKPTIRKLKAIEGPAQKKAARVANENAAKRHENAQLLALADHLGIDSTHKGTKVNRLGILSGIAQQTAPEGIGAKRRKAVGPSGGSPGLAEVPVFSTGGVPAPLSSSKCMPPPATARPVMPMATALFARYDLSTLAAAAEFVEQGIEWPLGASSMPTY